MAKRVTVPAKWWYGVSAGGRSVVTWTWLMPRLRKKGMNVQTELDVVERVAVELIDGRRR